MQHLIPYDGEPQPETNPIVYFGEPDVGRVPTEIDRLQGELSGVQARLARLESKRLRLRGVKRKLDQRAAALSLQIESLKSNPYSILRYRSSVPQQHCGRLWENEPTSTLRLESVPGIGSSRVAILYERCPTIGDLEVFRVFEGLESLPGIRRITAARIEKRLLGWLRRHADGYVPSASREHIGRGRMVLLPRRLEA